ncbi:MULTISPECIES: hypothetical protein [unclassified Microbacterium]|uniref:hypothetical protein n=1 Tax=unclassified Microbacterium TaxID=2609290 RepID=UPI003015B003
MVFSFFLVQVVQVLLVQGAVASSSADDDAAIHVDSLDLFDLQSQHAFDELLHRDLSSIGAASPYERDKQSYEASATMERKPDFSRESAGVSVFGPRTCPPAREEARYA